jgi:hypothetical protein
VTKGIYIFISGHESYANWAVILAASVKYYSPLHITLLHDGLYDKIPDYERVVFDCVVKADPKHYTGNDGRFQPGKFKLYLNEYFQHDQNIFIDADSILIGDISKLFDIEKDIAIQCYAKVTHESKEWGCKWADWNYLKVMYDLPKEFVLCELNSSFIFSKRTEKANTFWKQAQANFKDDYQTKWGTKFPDELAFDVATAQTGIDVSIGGDHYPITMTSKVDKMPLGLNKLKEVAPIMSFWGGYNMQLGGHYRNLEIQSNLIYHKVFGRQNPYVPKTLMKKKMVHREGVRLFKNKVA